MCAARVITRPLGACAPTRVQTGICALSSGVSESPRKMTECLKSKAMWNQKVLPTVLFFLKSEILFNLPLHIHMSLVIPKSLSAPLHLHLLPGPTHWRPLSEMPGLMWNLNIRLLLFVVFI